MNWEVFGQVLLVAGLGAGWVVGIAALVTWAADKFCSLWPILVVTFAYIALTMAIVAGVLTSP